MSSEGRHSINGRYAKRIRRVKDHLPPDWGDGWDNVWLGTFIENQAYINRMAELASIPAM